MPEQTYDIKFKFSTKDEEKLLKTLRAIAEETQRMNKATGKNINIIKNSEVAINRKTVVVKKGTKANKEHSKSLIDITRGNRILGGSLAVLRSKLLVVTFATTMLSKTFGRTLKAAAEQEKVMSQVESILRSTGHSANLTSIQLDSMAKGLASVTRFGDEAILSVERILLTFTNLKDEVFPEALGLTLDMAEAFGVDTKSAATQLGKALNDPVKGFTALRRIGISFTAEQEASIKRFAKQNDIISAQKVILDELQVEIGGVSKNSGQLATRLALLDEAWGDFQERLGQSLEPLLSPVLGFVSDILNSTKSESEKLIEVLGTLEQTPIVKESQLNLLRQQASLIEDTGLNIDVFGTTSYTQWSNAVKAVTDEQVNLEKEMTAIKASMAGGTLGVLEYVSSLGLNIDKVKEAIVAERVYGNTVTASGRVIDTNTNKYLEGIEMTDEMKNKILSLNKEEMERIKTLTTQKLSLSELLVKLNEMGMLEGFIQSSMATGNTKLKERTEIWGMMNNAIGGATSAIEANWKAFDNANKQKELSEARSSRARDAIEAKYEKIAEARRKKLHAWKVASSISNVALGVTQTWRDETLPTWAKIALSAAQLTQGYAQIATIQGQKFEQGGLVGGKRHSQGGTVIEAERGEFVMSRRAVSRIGVGNLEQLNNSPQNPSSFGGTVNIAFNGNVMTDDFIEDTAIPKIKEAVRRGADIGVS